MAKLRRVSFIQTFRLLTHKLVVCSLKALLQLESLTRFTDFVTRFRVQTTHTLIHDHLELKFSHPNPQIRSRNETFATKEPETLTWIETFKDGETLWDIGANVGLYSIYAAKRGCRVIAFEPSVFNLEFLVRNINLNRVGERVGVAALAIGGTTPGFAKLHMSSASWGDSQNNFDGGTPHGVTKEGSVINYQVVGLPLDSVRETLHLSYPHHIKIDVDGIEPEILESGPLTLQHATSVLVEIPQNDGAREKISTALTRAGLVLVLTQRQNQIWTRQK
jgi:FkbM family methyltransferase